LVEHYIYSDDILDEFALGLLDVFEVVDFASIQNHLFVVVWLFYE
jgi:hypothetical protein